VSLEGASSPPGQSKHHDIVNMKMAEYANAPVLLVGISTGRGLASF
jgi:cobyric acid synthase